MLKKKFLISLAGLSLLFSTVVACGGNKASSEAGGSSGAQSQSSGGQQQSGSGQQSGSQSGGNQSQSGSGGTSDSGSGSQAAHEHDYELVANSTVKNPDQKDVFVKECKDHDDKYIGIAFNDYSGTPSFGDTSSYTGVPEELRTGSKLINKDTSVTWRLNLNKKLENVDLCFGVVYTGGNHGTQGAKDGNTFKYSIQVNGAAFVDWDIGTETYGSLGMSQTARAYVRFATINLRQGENVITLRQNNAGYRLLFGGEVQLHYNDQFAAPIAAPAGYNVTFAADHAKVLVYEKGKDYSVTPKEATSTKTRDDEGYIAEYIADDATKGIDEYKPQVNFQIQLDNGYEFDDGIDRTKLATKEETDPDYDPNYKDVDVKKSNVSWISGDFNKLKLIEINNPADNSKTYYYRITKIKGDLTVTINAAEPVAQPTGQFHGLAKTKAETFIPVDAVLTADSVALSINGDAVTVSSYSWNGLKSELTVVTEGAYGTITASFANNVFTITAMTGEAATSQLDLNYAPALSGNCQFLDCSVMDINAINATFLRRYKSKDTNYKWVENTPDQNKMASVTAAGRKGLQCNGYAYDIGLSLKSDFATPIPGTVIKSIGVWIYNSGTENFNITVYAYKAAGRDGAASLNTFSVEPGWHFYQTGVVNGSNFTKNDSLYNFQLFYTGVSVNPVFDDFCLYM